MDEQNCISRDVTLKFAISLMDKVEKKLLVVCNDSKQIVGTISDGDIRRGILRGVSLDASVSNVLKDSPHIMVEGADAECFAKLMQDEMIFYVPVVNKKNQFIRLLSLEDLLGGIHNDYSVFILAGGLGSRLKELTKHVPKPMLPINEKPMVERLIVDLKAQGITKFYLSVNYLKDVIKAYFGDGNSLGVSIEYVEETQRLGTAGPLSLLSGRLSEQGLIVVNADVCTSIDYHAVIRYHKFSNNVMTVCAKNKEMEVPYGVINFQEDSLISVVEKPVSTYFINAGIYLIENTILSKLEYNQYEDMPDFINKVKQSGERVGIYPLHEQWFDVGLPEDYEHVNKLHEACLA